MHHCVCLLCHTCISFVFAFSEDTTLPTAAVLADELKILVEEIASLDSPLVFCHNDLLLKNIVYNKEKSKYFRCLYQNALSLFH
jgi:ethanolamine kinase